MLANINMEATHEKDVLQKNHVLLVDELDPDLFLHLLEPCLGKTCVDSIRDQPTQKDKTRKLLWILGTVPKEKYDYFCKVIACLYPSVFKVLSNREPNKEELDFYLQSYASELRRSVLATGNVPDNEIDQPIDLDTQYVRLALCVRCDDRSAFGDDMLPAEYRRDIERQNEKTGFNINNILPEPSRGTSTLIKGRAGVGKSTLTQYLIRQWAKGQWESSKTCVFLLNLRKLVHVQRDVTLTELLAMYSEYSADTPDQNKPSLQWLKINAHNVMILTDGIDELPDVGPLLKRTPKLNLTEGIKATPLDWCINLMQKNILPDCTKVLISRPFEDLKKLPCDRVVDVLGLTEERIMEFIDKNVKSCRRDIVRDTLTENPVLLSVSFITFYCATLCRVLEVNSDIKGISFNTYTRIMAYLIIGLAARKASEEATSFFMSNLLKHCLPYLAALAHRGLMQSKNGLTQLFFSEEDLRATRISQEGMTEAKRSGLLTYSRFKDPENPHCQKLQAQFIHLSIQEFLAAAKMVAPGDDSEQEIKLFKSGQFNLTDVFAFGLAFDRANMNISDIQEAVSQRLTASSIEKEVEGQMLEWFEKVCERAPTHLDAFLQALLIAHESQRKDLARKLGQTVIVDGHLKVTYSQLTSVDVMALCFMLNETNVKSLELCLIYIDTPSAIEIRDFILASTSLKDIAFIGTILFDEAMKVICDAVACSQHLKHLKLHLYYTSGVGICYLIDALRSSTSLTSLHLKHFQCSPDQVGDLCSSISSSGITHLTMEESLSHGDAFTIFCNCIHLFKGLKSLDLIEMLTRDEEMMSLSNSIQLSTSVESMNMNGCGPMSDEGFRYLCEAIKHAVSLTDMCLINLVIRNDLAERNSENEEYMSSYEYTTKDFTITDKRMVHLVDAVISTKTLTHLQLNGATISDGNLQKLADAVASSACLKSLEVDGIRL